ncbi:MAG: putative membrane protein [Bacteroidia bacterium]|jgi:uncharacterized membrane protein
MFWRPFSEEDENRIKRAIEEAESVCSGEVRVHIDQFCKGDPMFKASNLFFHLNIDETANRNGVLIYVAIEDRKFCIIGDSGIDNKVPDNFWDATKEAMTELFKKNRPVDAILAGIKRAGNELQHFFPSSSTDTNELSNDISYGE